MRRHLPPHPLDTADARFRSWPAAGKRASPDHQLHRAAVALGSSRLGIVVKSGKGLDYMFANKVAANGLALIERLSKK